MSKDSDQALAELMRCMMFVERRFGPVPIEEYVPHAYRGTENAPGHGHVVPGIWDRDNGAKAGKECAYCKAWNVARSIVLASQKDA